MYYNYTVIYWNGPWYSQITAYFGNDYVMFATAQYFTMNKTTMLNIMNSEETLIGSSTPYL